MCWIICDICNLQKVHKMNERERIELIMKSYGLSPSQFADRTGIQRASVSHIISGRNKASLEVMLKIYDAFPGLDMEWLMTGKGNEPQSNNSSSTSASAPVASLFSEPVKEASVLPFVTEEPARAGVEPVNKVAVKSEAVVSQPRERRAKRSVQRPASAMNNDVRTKQIREIRVYYTDGTYEILIPER